MDCQMRCETTARKPRSDKYLYVCYYFSSFSLPHIIYLCFTFLQTNYVTSNPCNPTQIKTQIVNKTLCEILTKVLCPLLFLIVINKLPNAFAFVVETNIQVLGVNTDQLFELAN